MTSLSAVVITLNSEKTLPRCLQSLSFADEIVVMDGGSEDATKRVAESFGARVLEATDWQGFGVQKNRAIREATGDWILLLDSDEWFENDASEEVLGAILRKTEPDNGFDAFRFRRRSRYLGRVVKHSGWWPDYVTRLFLADKGKFTDDLVHERLHLLKGTRIGKISAVIEHDAVTSIDQVISKINKYSSLSAAKRIEEGARSNFLSACIRSVWAFFRVYLLRLGVLDGKVGFLIAVHTAETTFYRHIKVWVCSAGFFGGKD